MVLSDEIKTKQSLLADRLLYGGPCHPCTTKTGVKVLVHSIYTLSSPFKPLNTYYTRFIRPDDVQA